MSTSTSSSIKYKLVILNDENLTKVLNSGEPSFSIVKLKHPKLTEKTPFIYVKDDEFRLYELISYTQEMGSLFINEHVQSECLVYFSTKINFNYFLIDFVSTTKQTEYDSFLEFKQKFMEHLCSSDANQFDAINMDFMLTGLKEFCDVNEDKKKLNVKFNTSKCVAWLIKKIETIKVYLQALMSSNSLKEKVIKETDKEEAKIKLDSFELLAQYVNKSVAEALRKEMNLSESKIAENDNGTKRQCFTLN